MLPVIRRFDDVDFAHFAPFLINFMAGPGRVHTRGVGNRKRGAEREREKKRRKKKVFRSSDGCGSKRAQAKELKITANLRGDIGEKAEIMAN